MNANFNQYGFPGNGMIPNTQTQPKTVNWLSAEQIASLQKGLSQFSLSVDPQDLIKGQCNHYTSTGASALIADQDGSGGCTCSICGTHFTPREYSNEEITTSVDNILDVLNTIKVMYLSIDPHAATEYFQIIPFIQKIPALYNIAINDFKKYEGVDNFVQGSNQNPFNIFSMMTVPGYGMGMMQQPNYGYAPQMPQQQPMYNGFAQQNPGFNPVYGQQMPQQPVYQPMNNGYSMNPTGAAAPQPAYGYSQAQQQNYINSNMPNAMNPTGAAAPAAAPQASTTTPAADTKFTK